MSLYGWDGEEMKHKFNRLIVVQHPRVTCCILLAVSGVAVPFVGLRTLKTTWSFILSLATRTRQARPGTGKIQAMPHATVV